MRARWLDVLGRQEQHIWGRCRVVHTRLAWHPLTPRRHYSAQDLFSIRAIETPSGLDGPTSELSVDVRRLLGKARLHGINSMEQLKFEADLGHKERLGSRLLDKPDRRQDLDLWLFLLDFARQSRGFVGVRAIFRGLIHRGQAVRLEPDNANARDLIDAFIYAGVAENSFFLRDVVTECVARNWFIDDLFVAVVGGLLRYRPELAPSMTSRMRKICYQGRHDLLRTFRIASESEAPNPLTYFGRVRDQLPDTNIYQDTIPYLWELGKPEQAFEWHRYLLARQDLPKTFEVLLPFIGYLARSGQDLEPFLHGLQAAGADFASQARRVYHREVERPIQNLSGHQNYQPMIVAGESHGKLKDQTIARALATSAFSLDFVMNAVHFLGTVEFGPLSMRQLILMCPDLPTLDAYFERLRELGIDTGSSTFVRIIHRLRNSRHFDLIKLLAESDMHHDEFSDLDLQRRLLCSYNLRNPGPDVTRTLTILNSGHTDRKAREHSTNLVLRAAAVRHDWRLVLDIVISLHRSGHRITKTVLGQLIRMLLPGTYYATRGFRPTFKGIPPFDTLSFLIGLLQQLLCTRTIVAPSHWVLPCIALGQRNSISELHALALFLARHYTGPNHAPGTDRDLLKLFTPAMQRALVAWDFKGCKWRDILSPKSPQAPFSRSRLKEAAQEPWLAGLRLLKRLRDEYGVKVDLQSLRTQYLFRIRQMAGAQGQWLVTSNKLSARMRGYKYRDFVEGWDEVWQLHDSNSHTESGGGGRTAKGVSQLMRDLHRDGGKWRTKDRYLTGPPTWSSRYLRHARNMQETEQTYLGKDS